MLYASRCIGYRGARFVASGERLGEAAATGGFSGGFGNAGRAKRTIPSATVDSV